MGMYLMRQIGTRGVYGNPLLPDFMVFLNWQELPWFWWGFDHFLVRGADDHAGARPARLVFGWLAFRSRVTGVYLSIITQAMTYALMLAFFRNDMGFGGNNGLTDFKDILGCNVQRAGDPARPLRRLGAGAGARLSAVPVHHHLQARPGAAGAARCRKPGAVSRLFGDQRQAVRLHRLGGARRHRRRALRAAGRHHQPERILARQLDRDRDLGLGRRARHAVRRDGRRLAGQWRQDLAYRRGARSSGCSSSAPCSCLRRCSFPRGIVGFCGASCGTGSQAHPHEEVGNAAASTAPETADWSRRRGDADPTARQPAGSSCTWTASRSASTASRR